MLSKQQFDRNGGALLMRETGTKDCPTTKYSLQSLWNTWADSVSVSAAFKANPELYHCFLHSDFLFVYQCVLPRRCLYGMSMEDRTEISRKIISLATHETQNLVVRLLIELISVSERWTYVFLVLMENHPIERSLLERLRRNYYLKIVDMITLHNAVNRLTQDAIDSLRQRDTLLLFLSKQNLLAFPKATLLTQVKSLNTSASREFIAQCYLKSTHPTVVSKKDRDWLVKRYKCFVPLEVGRKTPTSSLHWLPTELVVSILRMLF